MKKVISLIGISLILASVFAQSVINEKNAFPVFVKAKGVQFTEKDYASYVREYYRSEYSSYRNNEFEWEDILAKYKKELDDTVANVDLNAEYQAVTSMDLGDYDFTNGGFKCEFAEGLYFNVGTNFRDSWEKLEPGVDVYFSNVVLLMNGLEKDAAKALLASKANSYNKRGVTIQIIYKVLTDLPDSYKKLDALYEDNWLHPIFIDIQKINVYNITGKKEELIGELIIK